MDEASRHDGPTSMAKDIARWCETRAEELGVESARQFKLIVLIVVAGLVLLLVLPPLIGQIDFLTTRLFGGSPPIESLENTQEAMRRLDQQVAKSQERLDSLDGQLAATREKFFDLADEGAQLLDQVARLFSAPLAIWQRQDPFDGRDAEISDILVARDGSLLAAGYEFDDDDVIERILFLRSEDGRNWSAIRPQDEIGEWLAGWIFALHQAEDGTFFAAGYEGDIDEEQIVILRSEDGRNWSAIRPESEPGKRIDGMLNALAQTPDGALITAGYEIGGVSTKALILRSDDGAGWLPVRLENAQGEAPGGLLSDLAVSRNGTVIAAGYEGATSLLLRSTDRETWTQVRLAGAAEERPRALISALAVAGDGALIAAGSEGGSLPLLLRSEDGETWNAIGLFDAKAERITGSLIALTVTADGSLIAIGREGAGSLVLRSDDGRAWTAVRPEGADGSAFRQIAAAAAVTPEGTLYAAGGFIWETSLTGGPEGDWRNLLVEQQRPQRQREEAPAQRPEEVYAELGRLLSGISQVGFGYPEGTAQLRADIGRTIAAWDQERESETRITALFNDANEAQAQQRDTLQKVQEGTDLLARALTDADELRRASRIATRIAVVALLIYLVQIVVNRYRYLQRMEGFYRARAQALRLLTAMPDKAESVFKNVTVTDLMLALSPDGIGFDKSAEPPTQNMMNMFRESLRRERGG